MKNINYSKLGLFITFNVVLIAIAFLLANEISIPEYLTTIVIGLSGAVVGLFTSISEE